MMVVYKRFPASPLRRRLQLQRPPRLHSLPDRIGQNWRRSAGRPLTGMCSSYFLCTCGGGGRERGVDLVQFISQAEPSGGISMGMIIQSRNGVGKCVSVCR